MSKNRRRVQHSKVVSQHYEPAWDLDYQPEPVRPRYVPENWQEAWAATTVRVCEAVWWQHAWKAHPLNPVARDDMLDWIQVKACEFANRYTPRIEPDAEEHWGAALASVLRRQVRWHWSEWYGRSARTDNQGEHHMAGLSSLDALLERATRTQTMHVAQAHIVDGALGGWRPITPERYLLLLELDEHPEDYAYALPAKDPSLCIEGGCTRPARTRGLCKMHVQRAMALWRDEPAELPPTMRSLRPTTCTAEGCEEPVKMSGLCATHWLASRPLCSVEGCGDHLGERAAAGMCPKHYKRLRKTGTTDDPPPPTTVCTIEGCDRPHRSSGLCNLHYKRARKAAS